LGGTAVSLALLALLGIQLQAQRLERAVLDDWRALPVPPTTRPSHVSPAQAGTVADAFERAFAEPHPKLPHSWIRGEPQECLEARGKPLDALPKDCLEVIDAQVPWSLRLLAASRAEDATLPPELESWTYSLEKKSPERDAAVLAISVVSYEVRRAVARGEADAALGWCADGLGFGRDVALRLGPSGTMFASYWTVLFLRPCGEAIDAASPTAKRTFATAVDSIAAALPSNARLLKQAVAEREVEIFGASFDDATLAALPQPVVKQLKDRNPGARRWLAPWARRETVREAAALRSILPAAELAPAARDAAFAVAKERLAAFSPRELKVDELFERVDRLRLMLTLLANAARLDAGDATGPAAGLALTVEGDAQVLAPAAARLARHAVRLHKDPNPVARSP
jgi:hypothetical protein